MSYSRNSWRVSINYNMPNVWIFSQSDAATPLYPLFQCLLLLKSLNQQFINDDSIGISIHEI